MSQYDAYDPRPQSGWSTGAKVAVGCGITAFLILILVCGGAYLGLSWLRNRIQHYVDAYETRGYTIQKGDQIHVSDAITTSTAYFCQTAQIDGDATGSLGFMCQSAVITSHVQGSIDAFLGQDLTLKSGAEIDGDVIVTAAQTVRVETGAIIHGALKVGSAQMVTIQSGAIVEGGVSGNWQILDQASDAVVGTPGGDQKPPPGKDTNESQPQPPPAPPGDDGG